MNYIAAKHKMSWNHLCQVWQMLFTRGKISVKKQQQLYSTTYFWFKDLNWSLKSWATVFEILAGGAVSHHYT